MHDIRYENFLNVDKLKLAQAFLTNDDVIHMIQNSMFINKAMESFKTPSQHAKLDYSSSKSTLSKTICLNKPNQTNRRRDKSTNSIGKSPSFSLFYWFLYNILIYYI